MFDINTLLGLFIFGIGAPLLIVMALSGILGEIRMWAIDWMTYNKVTRLEKDLDHANLIIEKLEVLAKSNKGNNLEVSKQLETIKKELHGINKYLEDLKKE